MNRSKNWLRWILMAVLAAVAVYFFLFATRGAPTPPKPTEGMVKDPILSAVINNQLQAIRQSPEKLDHRLQLCMIYDANGLDDLAVECYEQLTELVPDHPRAWYHLGHLRNRQGDPEGAMAAMRTAASRSDKVPLPDWQLGRMLLDAGRPEEAIEYLNTARGQLGHMPAFLVTMMRAHIESGDPAMAVEIASSNNLTNSNIAPYVFQLLVQAHEKLGNNAEATQARALAGSDLPQISDTWMLDVRKQRADLSTMKARINSAIRAQKWNEAIILIEQLNQYEEPTREVQLMEITCLAQSGAPEEAAQKLQGLLADSPGDQQLMLTLAAVQLETGDLRQDLSQYEAALQAVVPILEENPSDLRATAIYIRALRMLGRFDDAIAACRAAWVSQPQQIGPLVVAAELIRMNESWAGNEDLLRNLWMAQPDHPGAGSMLVLALVEDDRVDEARQILESLNSASLDAGTLNRARDAVNAASNR